MHRITGVNRPRGTLLIPTPGMEASTQKQGEAPCQCVSRVRSARL